MVFSQVIGESCITCSKRGRERERERERVHLESEWLVSSADPGVAWPCTLSALCHCIRFVLLLAL